MTEFVFNTPKCFIDSKAYIESKSSIDINDKDTCSHIRNLLIKQPLAINEARWNWLRENRSEIGFIEIRTEDTGYSWGDIMRVYTNMGHEIYNESVNIIGRGLKSFRARLKRFNLNDIPIDIRTLH